MSSALAEPQFIETSRCRPLVWSQRAGADGETTLERLISSAWEGLAVHAHARCPVCSGLMLPLTASRAASGSAGTHARCRDCGSELD